MAESTLLAIYTPNSDLATGFNPTQFIAGRTGNDTVIGFQPLTATPGQLQIDILAGDFALDDPAFRLWSDTFILGDSDRPYYANGNPLNFGLNDFAFIADFDPTLDFIQLYGSANDYQLLDVGIGSALLLQQETGVDVVGFFLGATSLSLENDYFQFRGVTPPPGPVVPQVEQFGTPGFEISAGTTTDLFGNLYVVGGTTGSLGGPNNGDSRDALITKYDSDGNLLFTRQFGTDSFDTISDIATDPQGNFYVAGITASDLAAPKQGNDTDAFVAKFDSNGNQLWIEQFGQNSIFQTFSIDVDAQGNSYLSGLDVRPSPTDIATDDFWVSKFDTNGNQQWFVETASVDDAFDESYGITVSDDGSVYATGWTLGDLPRVDSPGSFQNEGLYDGHITKFDNNGERQWIRQFGTSDYDWSWDVDTDSQGNVYATGWTLGDLAGTGSAGSYDAFLIKYDSQGNQQWIEQFGSAGDDEGFELFIDNNDNLFLTGYTQGNLGGQNAGSFDPWVARYDTSGNQVWIQQFGTTDFDQAYGITSDSSGSLYVTGVTQGSLGDTNAGSFDGWVAKLDTESGTLLDFSDAPVPVNASSAKALLASDISAPVPVNASPAQVLPASETSAPQVTNQEMVDFIGNYFEEFIASNSILSDPTGEALLSAIYGTAPVNGDTIYGTPGNDTLYGGNDDDALYGKAGDDILYGGEGNNRLYGGEGNDKIYGGGGNDTIDGGEGNNLVYAGEGKNTVVAGAGNDEIYTGASDDIINAGGGNNLIYAGEGKNTINTGTGNDTIYTGANDDFIYAGAGDDLIYAGEGDNIIYGGTGNNTVYSGSGHDLLVLSAGEGASTLSNFEVGKDLFGLAEGLTFEQLSITQGNNGNEFFTQIGIANSDDLLATLSWVQADTITSSSFTFV
jgi:Ca2+-binding RTX toxin-like protein